MLPVPGKCVREQYGFDPPTCIFGDEQQRAIESVIFNKGATIVTKAKLKLYFQNNEAKVSYAKIRH